MQTTACIRHSIPLARRDLLAATLHSLYTRGVGHFRNSAAAKMAFHLNYIGAVLSRRERREPVSGRSYGREGETDG
jgi:hypothetical protein